MLKAIFPSHRDGEAESEAAELDLRGIDGYGSGAFGASRGDRIHNGTDFKAPPMAVMLSPVAGKVTKLGYPYADDLSYRYVELTDKQKLKHRLFYVDPMVEVGNIVEVDGTVGLVQHISARYNVHLMVNHVHYEIKTSRGEYLNPLEF